MMGSLRTIALVAMLAPGLALAQSNKDREKASELVKKAIAKSQSGDHATAVELYLEAYRIIPQPLLLSNIGSEYQQLNKPVEALKYFCKYIEADPTGDNISYATAQARTLYIELGGTPTVADQDLCKPIVKPAPEPASQTQVSAQPALQPGTEPADTPTSKTPVLRYAGIGVAVLGAGVFGAGVYYGLEAKKISDEISNHDPSQPWPADIKEREDKGRRAEKLQIAFMVGGGVALAAGITMVIVGAPKQSGERSAAIAPIITGDTVGFAAAGRF